MSLALRSLSPAWKCVPSVVSNGAQGWDEECLGGTSLVHSLLIGHNRVTLDLRSGVGYEHDDRDVRRRLSPAESRLLLLDWTRGRMPSPSPGALWVVEAASLVAGGSEAHWREWATTDLHAALLALLDSPIEWTDDGRERLVSVLESASIAPASVDGTTLQAIIRELGDVVASKWDHAVDSNPAPGEVSGCSEVEWDRVGAAGIDIGELGLRSRILGTVWTASVGQSGIHRRHDSAQLWARLVDDASGSVYDEVEMRLVDGVWSARGYVPPSARKTATRVDLTVDPALPARTHQQRQHVLEEQAWFRLLQFERHSSTNSSWAKWRDTYRERLGVAASLGVLNWSRPFFAEWHIQPTDLASGRPPLLSPDPAGASPSAT